MVTKQPLITSHPDIAGGQPIIAGIRITVVDVMKRLQANQSLEEIMRNLHLTREQVLAAQSYAPKHHVHVPTAAEEAADLDQLFNQ